MELQGHGGPAVMQRLLQRCLNLGARIAQPGEFTLRAFTHGKLDLAQAESVADLINATTERSARLASACLRGTLGQQANELAQSLTEIRCQLEAAIDFDDEDITPATRTEIDQQLKQIHEATTQLHATCKRGVVWQSGVTVALVGAPNAGKSSLLNVLCGRDAAIIDDQPGTTRDIVTATCEIEGLAVCISDTAGLHEDGGLVEQEGMRRTRIAAEDADVVVHVRDVTEATFHSHLDANLVVHNKIDLVRGEARSKGNAVWLSATQGTGIDLLRAKLAEFCGALGEEPPFLARARHVEALATALAIMEQAQTQELLPEQLAEYLRLAHDELGQITGKISDDDLLGEIFSRFCIGK